MTKRWSDKLVNLGACSKAVAWSKKQPSLAIAWKKCQRGDWMLWLVCNRDTSLPWSEERRPLVRYALACAAEADYAEIAAKAAAYAAPTPYRAAKTLARCADLVRSHYPAAPRLPL